MERIKGKSGDFVLVIILTLLLGVGLAMLFSASSYHAEKLGKDGAYFFRRQLIWLLFGCVAAYIISHIPLELLKRAVPLILFSSLILAVLPFFPVFGRELSGARRWIFLFGQTFQPSEYIKLSMIVYLSYILARKEKRLNDAFNSLLPPLLIVLIYIVIVYFQNDFSTAFIIFLIALSIFFIANVKLVYFFLLGGIMIPLSVFLLFTRRYWIEKIMVFLKLMDDPSGSGYQVSQANMALIQGGFLGQGLGLGTKKLGPLPEADSDFIFAVIGEEMGFLGLLIILTAFVLLAYRGYRIVFRCEDRFEYYLAFGITSSIVLQALLNITVVIGLIPATGIPLPFFSLGGSSLLINLIMLGILVNISRRLPLEEGRFYV
ncbi:MAG: putative lipid II flippase FtsW [Spirochaetales bacterium]|nr:putative lipid II flippase FtsW [Spirochaetales bacterium]